MNKYEFIDVWREVYPEKRVYTWRKLNTAQQGRSDCFLILEELMMDVNGIRMNQSHRSDHSLVFLELKTEGGKHGKQY